MKEFIKKLLDDHSGLVLTGVCLVCITGFIFLAKPPTPKAQPSSSNTAKQAQAGLSTIKGTLTVTCKQPNCQTEILSAYDVAVFNGNANTPMAQSPVDKKGQFEFTVPAGTYQVKTIPQAASQAITATANHTSTVTLKITD